MTGFLGWLAASALLFVLILFKQNLNRKSEQAVINNLVLEANRSLDIADVLRSALDGLLALLEMDSGAVHLLDLPKNTMVASVQKGFPEEFQNKISVMPLEGSPGLITRAVTEKKAIFHEDIAEEAGSRFLQTAQSHGYKSAACIPLFVGEQPIATLLVSSRRHIRFHGEKVKLMTSFGHALGLAVEKARLYEQVLLEKHRMTVINEITKIIGSSLDFPSIYQSFASKIKELIDYDRCVIILMEDEGETVSVFLLATPHETKLPGGIKIPAANTSAEWVLTHKRPQFEKDLQQERLFREDEILLKEGIRSAVRIPIWVNGEITGIFILNSKEPNKYSETDLPILEQISEHLALSLQRYFLFEQISRLSVTDELTGCGNRRMLRQEMDRELPRADRYGRTLGVLMIDIDNFKEINDTFGHLPGDEILVALAELIRQNVRDIDICIRYGGEEFLVILPETNLEGTVAVAEKIRRIVEEKSFKAGSEKLRITVSIGIAVYPQHAAEKNELIRLADEALYRAKQAGRNRSYISGEGPVSLQSLFS
ncbi:MAG: diguanylate cyclase [Bacillota bacterium]|nr:diguanylate cyclase [Bacillota bacterium]MDW7683269.1 diguanylate cyclase [Bacillota bacterium]